MLFFKFLTVLLVPLAASAVPTTSGNANEPHGLNTNDITTSLSAEAYKPSASNSSRDNSKFTTRQGVNPCDCSDPQSDCANTCVDNCSTSNDDLVTCLQKINCCSGTTGTTLADRLIKL
ncbi:hypothetical protein BGW80DRAFT_915480 [Lactifluus volemus]|nr:hypothetical protein BGW80DRAFT_915480 [Lactifluus volemus]